MMQIGVRPTSTASPASSALKLVYTPSSSVLPRTQGAFILDFRADDLERSLMSNFICGVDAACLCKAKEATTYDQLGLEANTTTHMLWKYSGDPENRIPG
jgi:hypothetical protein